MLAQKKYFKVASYNRKAFATTTASFDVASCDLSLFLRVSFAVLDMWRVPPGSELDIISPKRLPRIRMSSFIYFRA